MARPRVVRNRLDLEPQRPVFVRTSHRVGNDPRGELVFQSEERVSAFTLDPREALAARVECPGYLAWRPELYATGWSAAAER